MIDLAMENGKIPDLNRAPTQLTLRLEVAAEREIDGIGMGVLSNGAPFLTISGLARMCGVDSGVVVRITAGWQANPLKPRERKIRELIRSSGGDDGVAFIAIPRAGTIYHAVPDAVCMAVLEYYAFESRGDNDQAAKSYRTLARKGFRDFIYSQVKYVPNDKGGVVWDNFHEIIDANYDSVPDGYFSIFKETASMQLAMIREGVAIGCKFIPDSSIGGLWGRHWRDDNLASLYGDRVPYDHFYPNSYPQSKSNPQLAHCYPDAALKPFKKWLREIYIEAGLPKYLNTKIKDKSLTAPLATATLAAIRKSALPPSQRGIQRR